MVKLWILTLPMILLSSPSWLYDINPIDNNEIIGYGIDKEFSKAKQNAMSDIAESISAEVESSTNMLKSSINGKIDKKISLNKKVKVRAVLSGIKPIKAENIDGIWYIALKYDNAPLALKLKKSISYSVENEKQNHYLQHTELFKEINREIGKTLNYQIIRNDNLWQIRYKEIILPIDQNNFYKLFSNQSSLDFAIKANQSVYHQNDKMYFEIKNNREGYISILYVEHNGKVGLLLSNKRTSNSFTYPNLQSKDSFRVVNPYRKSIEELYIALFSTSYIDLSEFENVSNTLLDKSNYNFDTLLTLLDNYKYSTFRVKIRDN